MPKLEGLEFEQGALVKETEDGFVYVDVSGVNSISFRITENVDFQTLPAFISPSISQLSLTDINIQPEARPKWAILILVLGLLTLLGLVVYVILEKWYRVKYENYLFKNRNDLYNIVNYVHNSKKRGLSNSQISDNLRKAKWNSEQTRYVVKKYAGERTGMIELPFTKWFRKKSNIHSIPEHKKI